MLPYETLESIARRLRNARAAGSVEHALLIGLIALSAVGAVAAIGQDGAAMFEDTGNVLVESEIVDGAAVTLAADQTSFGSGAAATLTWSVVNGETKSATYRYAGGACAGLAAEGSGPHPYPIAGDSGSRAHPWSLDEAGCDVEICLEASSEWGGDRACVTLAVAEPRTAPTGLAFADATGAEPGAFTVSDAATIGGLDAPVDAAAFNGSFSLAGAGGPWFSNGTVETGDTLRLGMTAPSGWSETATMTIEVGDASANWSVTTRPQDTKPDALGFVDQTGVDPAASIASNAIDLAGFDGPLAVSVSPGAEFRLNGGAWASTGTADAGDQLQLRATSPAGWTASKTIAVAVGDTAGDWTITTRAQDTTPNAFSFTSTTNQPVNTVVTSNVITLAGFDGPVSASISGGRSGYFRYRTSSTASWSSWRTSAANVHPGYQIQLRQTTPTSYLSSATLSLTVGGRQASWLVKTKGQDCPAKTIEWSYCNGSVAAKAHGTSIRISGSGSRTSCTTGKDSGCTTQHYSGWTDLSCSNGTWQIGDNSCTQSEDSGDDRGGGNGRD